MLIRRTSSIAPRFKRPRRRTSARLLVGVLAVGLGLSSCDAGERLREMRDEGRTGHERYARALAASGLDATGMGRDWLVAADSVLRAPLDVSLPFTEAGVFSRSEVRAVAYRLSLAAGQRVTFSVHVEGAPLALFLDLFEVTDDSTRPLLHQASAERSDSTATAAAADSSVRPQRFSLTHEARRGGRFVVRVQPELLRDGRYRVEGMVAPILAFPVEGRGNGAVQSFFGANRDAGRRVHQGIDIFAPRGTPVLAATDGVVRSVAPNALGGNVVWLSDPERGQSLYYAHLDRHHVAAGAQVRLGDTLGFVGNSGNARTTKPHLHFGIYRRGEGAIDPYPWVRRVVAQPPRLVADTARLGTRARATAPSVALRRAPSAQGDTLRLLARDTPLQIVGATGPWYRVELEDGVAGYLPARLTALVRQPERTGETTAGMPANDAATSGAAPSPGPSSR